MYMKGNLIMNIISCFKIFADYEMLANEEWKIDNNKLLETQYLRNRYSLYDEIALELSVRAEADKVIGLTIKKEDLSFNTQNLYSVGISEVVEIYSKEDAGVAIVRYIKELNTTNYCLVMGAQSSDSYGGRVPFEVAQMLEISSVADVHKFSIEENIITATIINEKYEKIVKLPAPCVLVVGNVPKTYLKVPTLKDKLNAKNKQTTKIYDDNVTMATDNMIEITYITQIRNNDLIEIDKLRDICFS